MKHLGVYIDSKNSHDYETFYFLKVDNSHYTSGIASLKYFESKGWNSIARLTLEGKLIIPMEFVK